MKLFRSVVTCHSRLNLRTCRILKAMLLVIGCAVIPGPLANGSIVVQIGQNFTASTLGVDSDSVPPDAGLAVGTNHVTEFINGRYSVFNKTNAANVQTMHALAFWASAGISLTANLNVTDPRILFDPGSHRWFALMIDYDSTTEVSNRFLLAVSATADPPRIWRAVAVPADPTTGNSADSPPLEHVR